MSLLQNARNTLRYARNGLDELTRINAIRFSPDLNARIGQAMSHLATADNNIRLAIERNEKECPECPECPEDKVVITDNSATNQVLEELLERDLTSAKAYRQAITELIEQN